MSVRVMTQVWSIALPDSEKLVLLALADCANDEGGCWPSMATLATKCSKSDRTVQTAIKALVDKGHLTRTEKPGKGCSYVVHPRSACTPEAASPPKRTTLTPEAASDKPSRTINSEAKASSDEPIVDAWNAMCDRSKLGKVRKLTPARRKALAARRRDYSDADLLEAVERIGRSSFCCGSTGFRADFDFLLSPSKLPRILEGKYDDTGHAKIVSASGYEYRGSDRDIMREAERRGDMATYWALKAEPTSTGPPKPKPERPADPNVNKLIGQATQSLRVGARA